MTRNYIKPPMELDLDAFLQSLDASTTDEEEYDDHYHRTTVDELLLINSSPSSSPPSSPPHVSHTPLVTNSSDSLQLSTDTNRNRDIDKLTIQSKFRSTSEVDSGEGAISVSRQLPRLFGGGVIRSNAKPGAALAAAAAASRLIPTPHAAAIKLTREKSVSVDLESNTGLESSRSDAKLVEEDVELNRLDTAVELTENIEASTDHITGSEFSRSDAKLVEEDLERNHLETASVESGENFERITEHGSKNFSEDLHYATDVANASEVDGFDIDFRDDTLSSGAKPEIDSPSSLGRHEDIEGKYLESGRVSNFESIEGPHVQDMDGEEVKEDQISVVSEKNDAENTKLFDKDVENGLQAEQSEVSVDMGGIDIEKGSVKSDGRTRGTSMKPLEFAEDLERKHAFTGMHWEEGAAAQPMKLEGVHVGSTATPYFSVSTNNTITKTISSPSFRRDHGTPQALAVHLNYIAVGMSRGLIVVFPSKYSPHYADNMDAKVPFT